MSNIENTPAAINQQLTDLSLVQAITLYNELALLKKAVFNHIKGDNYLSAKQTARLIAAGKCVNRKHTATAQITISQPQSRDRVITLTSNKSND